jgi:hypothetical protein
VFIFFNKQNQHNLKRQKKKLSGNYLAPTGKKRLYKL